MGEWRYKNRNLACIIIAISSPCSIKFSVYYWLVGIIAMPHWYPIRIFLRLDSQTRFCTVQLFLLFIFTVAISVTSTVRLWLKFRSMTLQMIEWCWCSIPRLNWKSMYSALSIPRNTFSPKDSQMTAHISPARARYEVSFVNYNLNKVFLVSSILHAFFGKNSWLGNIFISMV